MNIKFRIARADQSEVQPLWFVLAVIRKNGYRIKNGFVRDVRFGGSFTLATLVWANDPGKDQAGAMQRICNELGEECTEPHFAHAGIETGLCAV